MATWYRLKLEPDDGAISVTAPDFPEVNSFGETEEEALRWGLDAILEAIAQRVHFKEEIPRGHTSRPHGAAVKLPMLVAIKLALIETASRQGVNRAELARRMGVSRETVDRLFRLNHRSTVAQLEAAFDALRADVNVTVDAA